MKAKDLSKLLNEKGLTPKQVFRIIESYEKQKERVKNYQKKKYYKVSISVPREKVDRISDELNISKLLVKKYLAGIKILNSVPKEVRESIEELLKKE